MNQLDGNRMRNLFQTVKYNYYRSPNYLGIPIILISGLLTGSWIWEPVNSLFQEKDSSFVVLQEPLASIGATIEELRQYSKDILDELNIHRATLVGNSYGELLALDLTTLFPERVHSIIVSGLLGMGNITNLGVGALGVSRIINRAFAILVFSLIVSMFLLIHLLSILYRYAWIFLTFRKNLLICRILPLCHVRI